MIPFFLLAFALCAYTAPLTKRQVPSGVPGYVTTYAPIIYLYSSDPYRPADIGSQLSNTQPEVNFTVISGAPNPLTLDNLSQLNKFGGSNVSLTSKDNVEDDPPWLFGVTPDSNGNTDGAVSCGIILNDHGSGLVDAFYMYFYAFDYGGDYVSLKDIKSLSDFQNLRKALTDLCLSVCLRLASSLEIMLVIGSTIWSVSRMESRRRFGTVSITTAKLSRMKLWKSTTMVQGQALTTPTIRICFCSPADGCASLYVSPPTALMRITQSAVPTATGYRTLTCQMGRSMTTLIRDPSGIQH